MNIVICVGLASMFAVKLVGPIDKAQTLLEQLGAGLFPMCSRLLGLKGPATMMIESSLRDGGRSFALRSSSSLISPCSDNGTIHLYELSVSG